MIDELIQQLDDVSPVRRKDAVIALGKSRDMAALRPLAKVYRTDPDPEVRELARKAGIYIRQQNEGATVPPKPTASPPRRMSRIPNGGCANCKSRNVPPLPPPNNRRSTQKKRAAARCGDANTLCRKKSGNGRGNMSMWR